MKWKSLTMFAAAVLMAATSSQAQQPTLSTGRNLAASPPARRPIFSQISWWARYGQPLEAPAAEPGVVEAAAEPMVMHEGGHGFGYVYGLGSCDCGAPCTDHLWAGYMQNPWRCSHPRYKERHHGGCGACGHVSDCGCTAPSCTAAATDCGCQDVCGCGTRKPFKQWLAHWRCGQACCDTCDSCSAPLGCSEPAHHGASPAALEPPAAAPQPTPSNDEASVLKKPLYRRVSVTPARNY